MRCRQADMRKRRARGPRGVDGRTGGWAVEWTGGLGGRGLESADGGSGGWADRWTGRSGAN